MFLVLSAREEVSDPILLSAPVRPTVAAPAPVAQPVVAETQLPCFDLRPDGFQLSHHAVAVFFITGIGYAFTASNKALML
jgi:hypothetical protein